VTPAAPGPGTRRGVLQAVRSAMEAERSGAGPHDATMANVVRDRLAFFRSALGELRAPPAGPA